MWLSLLAGAYACWWRGFLLPCLSHRRGPWWLLGLQVVPKQRYSLVFPADFPCKFEAPLNCLYILEADMPQLKANWSFVLVSVQCVSCAFYQTDCAGCCFYSPSKKNASLRGNRVGSRAVFRLKLHTDLLALLLVCTGVLSSVYIWVMVNKATTFYWRCQRWPERVLCQELLISKFNRSKGQPAHIFPVHSIAVSSPDLFLNSVAVLLHHKDELEISPCTRDRHVAALGLVSWWQ